MRAVFFVFTSLILLVQLTACQTAKDKIEANRPSEGRDVPTESGTASIPSTLKSASEDTIRCQGDKHQQLQPASKDSSTYLYRESSGETVRLTVLWHGDLNSDERTDVIVRTPFGDRRPQHAVYVNQGRGCYREVWRDYSVHVRSSSEKGTTGSGKWRPIDVVRWSGYKYYREEWAYDARKKQYVTDSASPSCPLDAPFAISIISGADAVDDTGHPLSSADQPDGYFLSAHPKHHAEAHIEESTDVNGDGTSDFVLHFRHRPIGQFVSAEEIPAFIEQPIFEPGVYVACSDGHIQEVLGPAWPLHFESAADEITYDLTRRSDTTSGAGFQWPVWVAKVWSPGEECRSVRLHFNAQKERYVAHSSRPIRCGS